MKRLLLSYSAVLLLSMLTKTFGQPGTLVTDFGDQGMTIIDIDDRTDIFNDMKILPDGSIIAVGRTEDEEKSDYLIVKFDQDGIPDLSFGTAGLIRSRLTDSANEEVESIIIAQDGSFYVAVNAFDNTNKIYILKYGSNGLLDTTFSHAGIFLDQTTQRVWTCNLIYLTSNQEILVATESGSLIRIFKLLSDGTIVSTFASDGDLILDQGNNFQRILGISSIAGPAGHSHLMVGENNNASGWNYHLFRISDAGQLDSTFGVNGYISEDFLPNTSSAYCVTTKSDGRILIAGGWHNGSVNEALLAQYTAFGQLDSSFGENGIVLVPTMGNNIMYALRILSDGSIVAAGDRAIIRVKPDGKPDSTYAGDGILDFDSFGPNVYAMQLDDQDNTIVAGALFNGDNLDLMIAKYRSFVTTAVHDQMDQASLVRVFPNPFRDRIQVTFNLQNKSNCQTYLTDLQGRLVTEIPPRLLLPGHYQETLAIDRNLLPGVYLLQQKFENRTVVFKVFKL
ncbi:MAG: T9SS type A sorting domain-containing protein [Saprospiraceae bacterium]|nr:T9SS type A sorting domain-containing protein [Saprospiraceae bacterium]